MVRVVRKIGTPFFYILVILIIFLAFLFKITAKSRILITFLIAFTILLSTVVLFWIILIKDLPPPEALTKRSIDISTKIYDKNGKLLYNIYKDKNRTLIKLSDIPIHVRLATIAAEDADFYNHRGISLKGITRAAYKLIRDKKITGGSTITQQLVKNAFLSPDKTITRKIREIFIALAVEQKYTKDEILEMYLNEVNYGGTAYGIQEAARQYFAKNAKELTLPEAALLAGLPKSPTLLSPFGPRPEASLARQKEVLNLMRQAGFISDTQLTRATNEKIRFALDKNKINAPHFVMYVKEILAQKYGEEFVQKSGLEVTTTLDLDLQDMIQEIVTKEIQKLKKLNVTNGAALVIEPQTGAILAMIGSSDYFDKENNGQVNVTLRPRQPGSSIKVVNYAYALSHGMTPATIIEDSPSVFNIPGQAPYIPRNYDGKFRGKITLRSALAESRNIPAVKVLSQIGINNMIETGKKMGIYSWKDSKNYGLSLTLGGGEVSLYELANVYATLANYGKRPELYPIQKITDINGNIIYEHTIKSIPAIDPRIAFILTDILKDNQARAPAFGMHSNLVIPNHREIAVKTGTSNDLRDNLTVGYNQKFLVAVWVGNNNNTPMSRIASGLTGASSIWNNITSLLVAETENHPWDVPEGLVRKKVCSREEWFLVENSNIKCRQFESGEPMRQSPE